MNILYRGNWKPPKYKFECDRCGSVWECEEHEMQKIIDRGILCKSCICPICGKMIVGYKCLCKITTKAVDK